MDTQDFISIIIGILGIGGVVFTVYNSFKNPQVKIEKDQIKAEEDLKDKATILSQKEVENKAQLLAQQFQWEKEANEKRFVDMGTTLKEAMTLAQNHIHTIDVKVDDIDHMLGVLTVEVTKLSTIISERIPQK